MLRFTLVRLGQAILVLFVVATVVFLLSRASGNYAELVAPPDAPPETIKQIEQNLGLDKPLISQYVDYMKDLLHGDLGQSFAYRQPVRDLIAHALPNTIELGVCAFAFATVFGLAIGVRSDGDWILTDLGVRRNAKRQRRREHAAHRIGGRRCRVWADGVSR